MEETSKGLGPGQTPQSVLAEALRRRDRLDYRGVVALCDPDSMAAWFSEYCEATRPLTIESLRRKLPRVSEERLELALASLGRWDPKTMRGTQSHAELLALTPEEFALRWLEHDDFRCDILRRCRARGRPIPDLGYAVLYGTGSPEWIPERENEVRVHYWYADLDGSTMEGAQVEYEQLRSGTDGEWRLVARWDLLRTRGSSFSFIPAEFADLYDADEIGGGGR